MKKQMRFVTEQYKIKRLNTIGCWLVETTNPVDLAFLFLRAQEFYESSNPDFFQKSFSLLEYIRWYSLEISDSKSFTYSNDYEGFNIPGTEIDKFLNSRIPDPNRYDMLFAKIVSEIKGRQQGDFCLIGVKKGDIPTLFHEISHAMYQFVDTYEREGKKLVKALPLNVLNKVKKSLKANGYNDVTIVDEIVAYFATGLPEDLTQYDYLRFPFIELFNKHKKNFLEEK
jgi:uncharacterized protein (UPF0297 family)